MFQKCKNSADMWMKEPIISLWGHTGKPVTLTNILQWKQAIENLLVLETEDGVPSFFEPDKAQFKIVNEQLVYNASVRFVALLTVSIEQCNHSNIQCLHTITIIILCCKNVFN